MPAAPIESMRERIEAVRQRLLAPSLTPAEAREALVQVTALWACLLEEAREAELAYKPVLLAHLRSEASANRARMAAECSPEFARYRMARDLEKFGLELIRACKTYLRSLEEELRLQ